MKKILLLLLACAAFSCSDDDKASDAKVKMLEKVTSTGGYSTTIQYDSSKRIQNISMSQGEVYDFTYNGDKISILDISNEESGDKICGFSYDTSGKISKITVNAEQRNVTYNEADQSYAMTIIGSTLRYKLFVDDNEYITKMVGYDGNTVQKEYTVTYDTGIGPLANTNKISIHLALALPNDVTLATGFSGKVVKSNQFIEWGIMRTDTYENLFDAENYLVRIISEPFINGEVFVSEMHYKQL